MKINYSNLTFTELVNKIGSSRFFDLPSMLKEILSRLTPQAPKYKVYTALLSQSGTDAPVATVLENTLGDIVWTRTSVGEYRGNLTGIFIEEKTFLLIQNYFQSTDTTTNLSYISVGSQDNISINSFDDTSSLSDDFLYYTSVEIRVYN